MSFESLGLRAELVRAVSEKGYSTPTPIQHQAIPKILNGQDIMAGSQTGTGKTAGFTLPLLQRLAAQDGQARQQVGKHRRPIRALVLTPTRELAAQVEESIRIYGKYMSLVSTIIVGGVKINPQISKLRKGVDIVVATPGRLFDHVSLNTIDLSSVEILVLDEADRMLDMGFLPTIRSLVKLLPRKKQVLFFSATFSPVIKKLANEMLNSPALIDVEQRNTTAERVSQVVHPVDKSRKRELLSFLIGSRNWKQVLVFTRTKHSADRLSRHLMEDGIRATAIHGNKTQGARSKALADFKAGHARVLVATDIAARGLDIKQLPFVVNYELPSTAEDYIHRIGRTGRAGNEGEALSLVCVDEHKLLNDIERLIKQNISRVVIEDFEPDKSIKAEPIHQGRGKQQHAPKRNTSRSAGKKPHSASKPKRHSFKARSGNSGRPESRPQGRSQRSAQPAR